MSWSWSWGGGGDGGARGPVAATAAPAGLIICNTAAAQPVCSHPLMNTEMNVSHIGGERGGKKQAGARVNQLPDRTITLSTSAAQR